MDKNINTTYTSERGQVFVHPTNEKTLITDLRVIAGTDSQLKPLTPHKKSCI